MTFLGTAGDQVGSFELSQRGTKEVRIATTPPVTQGSVTVHGFISTRHLAIFVDLRPLLLFSSLVADEKDSRNMGPEVSQSPETRGTGTIRLGKYLQ